MIMTDETSIAQVDTRDPSVRALIQRHVTFSIASTTPENVFALSAEDLAAPGIVLFGLKVNGALAGIAALRPLGDGDCELKSMHVAREFRGRGLGKALLDHMIDEARSRIFQRILLETGSGSSYEAARKIYVEAGFEPRGPFAQYPNAEESIFYELDLVPVD